MNPTGTARIEAERREQAELELRKSIIDLMLESEVPRHDHPPILADTLACTTIALSRGNGLAVYAMSAMLVHLRRTLDDFIYRRPPFEEHGPVEGEGADLSLLIADGLEQFIRLFFSSLGGERRKRILRGQDDDVAAQSLLQNFCTEVRGGRPEGERFTAGDLGALLERVSWMVLASRYPDSIGNMREPWAPE